MNPFEDKLINLSNFKKQYTLFEDQNYKYYEILNLSIFMAKVMKEDFKHFTKEKLIDFSRELHINSKINHPSLLNFIGYNLTNFTFSKEFDAASENNEYKFKGKFKYLAPETLSNYEYSKSSDIYSFSLIMYEIFSGRKPFKKLYEHGEMEVTLKYELKKLKSAISTISRKGIRPELNESVPECFRQLIEKCWSNDPKMRPTIDEILIELKTNSMFINEKINKDEFYKYVKIIDDSKVSFVSNQELKAFDDIFNSRSHLFHKSDIDLRKRGSLNIDSNLNLDKYSQIDRIKSVGDFNYLKIAEKETNLKFTARVFLNEISKLCRNEVKIFVHTINTISQLNHPCILN